jgi:hypothetical protein
MLAIWLKLIFINRCNSLWFFQSTEHGRTGRNGPIAPSPVAVAPSLGTEHVKAHSTVARTASDPRRIQLSVITTTVLVSPLTLIKKLSILYPLEETRPTSLQVLNLCIKCLLYTLPNTWISVVNCPSPCISVCLSKHGYPLVKMLESSRLLSLQAYPMRLSYILYACSFRSNHCCHRWSSRLNLKPRGHSSL